MKSEDNALKTIEVFERKACPACQSKGTLLYQDLVDAWFGSPGHWALNKCSSLTCGSLWLNPAPTPDDLPKVYQSYYTHGEASNSERDQPAHISKSKLRHSFQYLKKGYLSVFWNYSSDSILQRLLGSLFMLIPPLRYRIELGICEIPYIKNGCILDVGCGDGSFLSRMQDLGWNTFGTEIDPKSAACAKAKGIDVTSGDLLELKLPSDHFDFVVLNHVVEHVYDIPALFRECLRILKPNGELRVLTPNPLSLGHAYFKGSWRGLEPPRHLTLLTPSALESSLRENGFSTSVKCLTQAARFNYNESKGNRNLGAWVFLAAEVFLGFLNSTVGEEVFAKASKTKFAPANERAG